LLEESEVFARFRMSDAGLLVPRDTTMAGNHRGEKQAHKKPACELKREHWTISLNACRSCLLTVAVPA
jgi:hypothetical protein